MTDSSNARGMASHNVQGIICILVGMLLFAGQDALMKDLVGSYTVWLLIFVRAVVTAAILIPLILYLGGEHRLKTPYWWFYILRGALFAFGFSLFYAGFPYMTFASLVTIFFAAPLITALMAAVFLGEKIGPYRTTALLVGFSGVVVSMKPGADSFQWVSVLPLICAVSYSISQILVRQVGTRDSTLTIGLYTIVCAGFFVIPMGWLLNLVVDLSEQAPHLAFRWFMPAVEVLPMLVLLGAIGMGGYILLSRAYQVGDTGAIAPLEYIYVPIAAALGYLAWGEVPVWNTLVGMVLIVASGIYIGHREMIDSRRKETPAPTAETPFVPGHAPPLPPSDQYDDG